MSNYAIRRPLEDILGQKGSNPGLILNKYLRVQDEPERLEILEKTKESLKGIHELYTRAFERYEQQLANSKKKVVTVKGRMVLGMGSTNVLETGLTLHHTYGIPVIPGSSLKGLAAHYCDRVWGLADEQFQKGKAYHEAIFGTTNESGYLIFHDAWVLPESLANSLQLDVMTVHHQEYYRKAAAPTDFDDPTPIPFLSVTGKFLIAVSCLYHDEQGKKWESLAMTLLLQALKDWGIGGKTSSGYGRLEE